MTSAPTNQETPRSNVSCLKFEYSRNPNKRASALQLSLRSQSTYSQSYSRSEYIARLTWPKAEIAPDKQPQLPPG